MSQADDDCCELRQQLAVSEANCASLKERLATATQLCEAYQKLCTAYRLGSGRLAESALNAIEKAKKRGKK